MNKITFYRRKKKKNRLLPNISCCYHRLQQTKLSKCIFFDIILLSYFLSTVNDHFKMQPMPLIKTDNWLFHPLNGKAW